MTLKEMQMPEEAIKEAGGDTGRQGDVDFIKEFTKENPEKVPSETPAEKDLTEAEEAELQAEETEDVKEKGAIPRTRLNEVIAQRDDWKVKFEEVNEMLRRKLEEETAANIVGRAAEEDKEFAAELEAVIRKKFGTAEGQTASVPAKPKKVSKNVPDDVKSELETVRAEIAEMKAAENERKVQAEQEKYTAYLNTKIRPEILKQHPDFTERNFQSVFAAWHKAVVNNPNVDFDYMKAAEEEANWVEKDFQNRLKSKKDKSAKAKTPPIPKGSGSTAGRKVTPPVAGSNEEREADKDFIRSFQAGHS